MKHSHRIPVLVLSCAVSCAALAGAVQGANAGKLVSDCGGVDIPADASTSGVVCLGICGVGHARNMCVIPGRVDSLRPQEPPLQDIESLVFLADGDSPTVASAAGVLRASTGWRVEVMGNIEGLPLRPQHWEAPWERLPRRRLRTEDGVKVRILVDDSAQTMWLTAAR
jgi:hypothetical protein